MTFISPLVDEYTCKKGGWFVGYRSLVFGQHAEDINSICVSSVVHVVRLEIGVVYVMEFIIWFELGEGCKIQHAEHVGLIERKGFRC